MRAPQLLLDGMDGFDRPADFLGVLNVRDDDYDAPMMEHQIITPRQLALDILGERQVDLVDDDARHRWC